jgi:hypothetical protein
LPGKNENLVNKNQGWEPIHQKYKANENTSRYHPKKEKTKSKRTKIKDNKEDLNKRAVSFS